MLTCDTAAASTSSKKKVCFPASLAVSHGIQTPLQETMDWCWSHSRVRVARTELGRQVCRDARVGRSCVRILVFGLSQARDRDIHREQ